MATVHLVYTVYNKQFNSSSFQYAYEIFLMIHINVLGQGASLSCREKVFKPLQILSKIIKISVINPGKKLRWPLMRRFKVHVEKTYQFKLTGQ